MKKGTKQTLEHIIKRTLVAQATKRKRVYINSRKGLTKENCESIRKQSEKAKKEKIELICQNCGKVFYLLPWEAKNRKFCSKECRFSPEVKQQMKESRLKFLSKQTGKTIEELKSDIITRKKKKEDFKDLSIEERKKIIGNKISLSKLGKSRSEETINKVRLANIGRKHSKETCLKRSLANKGRKRSESAINNFVKSRKSNGWFKNPKEVGEKVSKANKGKTPWNKGLTQETDERVAKTVLTKSLNPLSVQGGCKYYETPIGKVQGTYELAYVTSLLKNKKEIPVAHPKGIKTPFGTYMPDFEYGDRLVEIKSKFTYLIMMGANKGYDKKYSIAQWNKLKWVNDNIKPVEILIGEKIRNKLIFNIAYPEIDITGSVL